MADITTEENKPLDEEGTGDWKPYNFSVIPFNIEQHLEFIEINEDGYLLLSSSNLVTRNWTGSVWLFKTADVHPKKEECISGHGCESAVSCGKFLDSWEKILVGEDTGKLSLLKVNEYDDGSVHFVPYLSATHHDACINSLCINNNNLSTVTAGADMRINVWDNNLLELQQKYCPAHSMPINEVIPTYYPSELFTSCGGDGLVLMWDPRQPKPATGLYESNCGINSISWIDENLLAIGNLAGDLELIDIRNKSKFHSFSLKNCAIHHITSNNKGLLAACGNSNTIKVWDTKTTDLIFTNDDHSALVRGLSWHPLNDQLYSCGFDKRILSHDVFLHETDIDENDES